MCAHIDWVCSRLPKHSFKLEFLNCALLQTHKRSCRSPRTQKLHWKTVMYVHIYVCFGGLYRTQIVPLCMRVYFQIRVFTHTYAAHTHAHSHTRARFAVQSNSLTYRFASSPVFCALRYFVMFHSSFFYRCRHCRCCRHHRLCAAANNVLNLFHFVICLFSHCISLTLSISFFHSYTHSIFALVHSIISFHFMVNAWNIHANWK